MYARRIRNDRTASYSNDSTYYSELHCMHEVTLTRSKQLPGSKMSLSHLTEDMQRP